MRAFPNTLILFNAILDLDEFIWSYNLTSGSSLRRESAVSAGLRHRWLPGAGGYWLGCFTNQRVKQIEAEEIWWWRDVVISSKNRRTANGRVDGGDCWIWLDLATLRTAGLIWPVAKRTDHSLGAGLHRKTKPDYDDFERDGWRLRAVAPETIPPPGGWLKLSLEGTNGIFATADRKVASSELPSLAGLGTKPEVTTRLIISIGSGRITAQSGAQRHDQQVDYGLRMTLPIPQFFWCTTSRKCRLAYQSCITTIFRTDLTSLSLIFLSSGFDLVVSAEPSGRIF